MKILTIGLLFFHFLIANCQNTHHQITALKLIKALPVEYSEPVEPSGLCFHNGNFYTVSDDHDQTIFRLKILEDLVILQPSIKFEAPPLKNIKKFDLEGITSDQYGNFYLCSERACQILFVSHDGKDVHWVFESLKPYGQRKGLFQIKNAYLEGIAIEASDHVILCAERQPRGIFNLNLNSNPAEVDVYNLNKSRWKLPESRFPDFTGLFIENKTIYVLERSASFISHLIFQGGSIEVSPIWSYAQIENSDEFRYTGTPFASGEGLAMDDENVYVILDNNGLSRYSNPEDTRPLLFIMERPKGNRGAINK